jgi:aminoglycoside phosphotransferase (APT) family kinase protein
MTNNHQLIDITSELAQKLILEQFPEYGHLPITSVERQGHDNRTFRLGNEMLIRMPTAENYALKVAKEQELLPKLKDYLSFDIPAPIKMGAPSADYPYPFSIYKWLEGRSINLINRDEINLKALAFDMARFLKELQLIKDVAGPMPGSHNWWRGDHITVYDKDAREQIAKLAGIIDAEKAMNLWNHALNTKWNKAPSWIHGDFAIGNILMKDGKLSAVIDFGGMGMGDPACDLVIAWTYLEGSPRKIFIKEMNLDEDTWLRAKAWALWKASFVLCELDNKNNAESLEQRRIIDEVLI